MATLRQPTHQQFVVNDDAAVGAVRRRAAALASLLDTTVAGTARAELVGTELATNLLRHADPGGWMLLRPLPPAQIELIAVDRGPGITDPGAALDGRSPAPKGLGCGLAAARRASSLFDLYTGVGAGTVVLSVVDLRSDAGPAPGREYGGVSVGLSDACGDGWAVAESDERRAVAVVDGVGHGVAASAAADVVLETFAAAPTDLRSFLARGNEAARGTRGAVATICLLDPVEGTLQSLAVGNVNGRVLRDGTEKGLVTYSGSLGLVVRPPTARPQTHPWTPGTTLVIWTDGLRSRLELLPHAKLFEHDPTLVATVLHRDFARGTDDATVVVVRAGASGPGPKAYSGPTPYLGSTP